MLFCPSLPDITDSGSLSDPTAIEGAGVGLGEEEVEERWTGGAELARSSSLNATDVDAKPSTLCPSLSLSFIRSPSLKLLAFVMAPPPFLDMRFFLSDGSAVSMFLDEPNLKKGFFFFFSRSGSVSTEKDIEVGRGGRFPWSLSLSLSLSFLSMESGDFSRCAEG